VASHASAAWLKDGIADFYSRANSRGWIRASYGSCLMNWCLWMGLAIHPQMSHTQRRDWRAEEVIRAVSAVRVDMCFLTVCHYPRARCGGERSPASDLGFAA
jgi:hypothetical protein